MARTKSALHGFLKDIDAARIARGRNTLAAWLRTHHDELLAELDGRPIDWKLYLAVFTQRGLKDADGNTPTKPTASKTWHRVRAAIAAERAPWHIYAPENASRLAARIAQRLNLS